MNKYKIKDSEINLLDKLPDDIEYEDLIAEIYFKKQVEEGIMQLETGTSLSNEEVKRRLDKGLK